MAAPMLRKRRRPPTSPSFFASCALGNARGRPPLIDAARHGLADVAALFVDGTDVNEPKTDGSGLTALFVASQEGHAEVATKLLAAGANVNQ